MYVDEYHDYSLNQFHERMADGPKQLLKQQAGSNDEEQANERDGRVNKNTKRIDMP